MAYQERLLALSNSLILVQGSINKILRSGYAGHQEELEEHLSQVMGMMCILNHESEIDLDSVQKNIGQVVSGAMEELSFKFHITNRSPESIRRTLKLVE